MTEQYPKFSDQIIEMYILCFIGDLHLNIWHISVPLKKKLKYAWERRPHVKS